MNKLDGKVALVTGAGKGIGRGIARLFAAEGCHLMLTSRTLPDLQSVQKELGEFDVRVAIAAADVANAERMHEVFKEFQKQFDRLDILVNNAGAFDGGPLDQLSLDDWDRVIATNLRGPFICTQHAMRIMKQQQNGRIINVGSISGQRVRYGSAPYSTSKHGLWGLTQVTALEGREHGITCGCLCPGNILTERRGASDAVEDQEPMIRVEDIAEVALLMAALPPNVEMLEAIVLPHQQLYVGRG